MKKLFNFIHKYLGWRNWSVLTYNSVFENVFLLFYISLRNQFFSFQFILDFFFFLLFSTFSTTYGYLINDLADKKLDAVHGKENTFENDSTAKASLVVLLFLGLSIIFGLRFIKNPYFLFLWLCWGLIATFYSLEPIRLKQRGKAGLIFVVLAQRMLPTLIIFAAFKHYDLFDVLLFTAYIFFRGLSSDLNHQLEDYQKDSITGTETYAVQTGLGKARKVFRFSLEAEKGLLLLCLLIMLIRLINLRLYGIPFILPILLAYLLLYIWNWTTILSYNTKLDVNPFVSGKKDIFQFIHHSFPSVVLPLFLLIFLSYEKWIFSLILVLFIVYRRLYSIESIRNSFPGKILRRFV